jgi:hypothetical protein
MTHGLSDIDGVLRIDQIHDDIKRSVACFFRFFYTSSRSFQMETKHFKRRLKEITQLIKKKLK